MVVAVLEVKIMIPGSHSLKEKRRLVKSLCTRTRNKFNVSIAEVKGHELYQTAFIGLVFVTRDFKHADSVAERIISFLAANSEDNITIVSRDVFKY